MASSAISCCRLELAGLIPRLQDVSSVGLSVNVGLLRSR
jgi:hypothetical protein